MQRSQHVRSFVQEIWQWYRVHKRELPWRELALKDDNERAYRILVSEVMLQQTQVARVKIVFKEFLGKFPRMRDLAAASNRDVLIAWRGMGYNSRALRLRDAAKTVIERFHGKFPESMEQLQQIKGIGHYTAAAIRNFAFGIPTPCIDTNIRRVLHRTFIGPENPDGTWKVDDKKLLKLAEKVLQAALREKTANCQLLGVNCSAIADWHHALMDFGSLVQTKTNPKWDLCPLTKKGLCKAATRMRVGAPRWGARVLQKKREPGRFIGSKFIPNRIFRGKIVEELRDARRGLPLPELGKRICLDWKRREHEGWLKEVLAKLEKDALIERRMEKYILKM